MHDSMGVAWTNYKKNGREHPAQTQTLTYIANLVLKRVKTISWALPETLPGNHLFDTLGTVAFVAYYMFHYIHENDEAKLPCKY